MRRPWPGRVPARKGIIAGEPEAAASSGLRHRVRTPRAEQEERWSTSTARACASRPAAAVGGSSEHALLHPVSVHEEPRLSSSHGSLRVALTGRAEVIESWLRQSYGEGGLPGRAHVTTTEAKRAFDIGDVPDTWLLEGVSLSGVPYERMVLIEDQDPRTVRGHRVEVQDGAPAPSVGAPSRGA